MLASIANLEKPLPVVYVTGSSELSVAVSALKAGAADFVPKTVNDDFMPLLSSAFSRAVEKERLRETKEQAEKEVRDARDRAELLLREVNHRIANSLSMVASFVNLQSNSLSDEVAKSALAETQNRIQAVALVHRELYTKGDFRIVALDEYLAKLIEHIRGSIRGSGTEITIEHKLTPLSLPTDASINLGVIVTEWISNALKYAYPTHKGQIQVVLRVLDEKEAELTVSDQGVGHESDAAAIGTGFGTRIVRAMASSLKGQVEHVQGNPGTIARLKFPVSTNSTRG